jgi:peptide/nickel transport system substrate-binding protein/oligopeptide transport system substrate-binding protein
MAACSQPAGNRTLHYALSQDPRSLDPALSTDVPTGEMVTLVFDNLVQVNVDGELIPGLARSWSVDSGGTLYTFHLRPEVRFHDGSPLTAATVERSLRRALAPGSGAGRGWPLYPIQGARAFAAGQRSDLPGIRVVDDTTLALALEEPLNIFLTLLAMPVAAIVPDSAGPSLGERPVGTGPWRFVSWAHDDALVFARHEGWWNPPPQAETLTVRIIPEELTQAAEYELGRLSVVEVPFGETTRWETTHGQELERRPALRTLYLALNTTRGPLADPRVRRALNLAIDREAILASVAGGRGVLAAGAIPPGLAGHDSTRRPYPFDPDGARRLLAQAGGTVSLRLWRSSRPIYARIAQSIQQDLGSVGVTVEIVERDAASARSAARNGEADLFLTDWYGDYPDAENFTYPLFHSRNAGSGGNLAFLRDPALDSLIVLARSTPDSAEKIALMREIDRRVFELAPWVFLWFPVDLWAVRPEIEGWRIPAVFNGQRWLEVRPRP